MLTASLAVRVGGSGRGPTERSTASTCRRRAAVFQIDPVELFRRLTVLVLEWTRFGRKDNRFGGRHLAE